LKCNREEENGKGNHHHPVRTRIEAKASVGQDRRLLQGQLLRLADLITAKIGDEKILVTWKD
jgi:hypothetical protein